MELRVVELVGLEGECKPQSQRLDALVAPREIAALRDHHVATLATPALDVAPGRRVFLDGGNHLEQLVSDRKEGILEPELRHSAVAVADLDAEDVGELVFDGRELARNQCDLFQA